VSVFGRSMECRPTETASCLKVCPTCDQGLNAEDIPRLGSLVQRGRGCHRLLRAPEAEGQKD